ncbi:MAG: GNAT family N-acetyltransferase [Thermoanaerobaculia bacterium]
MGETVLETDRLVLRKLSPEHSGFILVLLNDPSWLRFIGDRGVRTLEDARKYILDGPVDSYERVGFGMYLTELKETGEPIGICGLVKRDALDDVDIGYAFLPRFRRQGFALEAAAAVMRYGKDAVGLRRIVAITDPDNEASIRVLEKLGMRYEKKVRLSKDGEEISLYGRALA